MALCVVLASCVAAVACSADPEPPAAPGPGLRERVEQSLAARRSVLERSPAHLGLIAPVEEARLRVALAPVVVHVIDGAPLLGGATQPEPHGGGLLALLLDHWRPEGGAATLDDRFDFGAERGSVRLGDLYATHRRQLVLPASGDSKEPGALPRMRFHFPAGGPIVETDAYRFLGVLLDREPDTGQSWQNAEGEPLSVDALLEAVRACFFDSDYLARADADHGRFHLVPLLLGWARRAPGRVDLDAVLRRFLEVELSEARIAGATTEALSHSVEALGRLATAPGVAWSAADRHRAEAWLARLSAERFGEDLDRVPVQHLAHLLAGLRAIDEAWAPAQK